MATPPPHPIWFSFFSGYQKQSHSHPLCLALIPQNLFHFLSTCLLRSLSLHSQWGGWVSGRVMKLSQRREPRKGGTEEACQTSWASPATLGFLSSAPLVFSRGSKISALAGFLDLSLLSLIPLSFLDFYPDPLLLWITARVGKCNYKGLDVRSCVDKRVKAYHTAFWKTLINFLCFSWYQIQTTLLMALKWSAIAAP